MRQERRALEVAWTFGIELVVAVTWSSLIHSWRLPQAAAVFLLPSDVSEKINLINHLKKMVVSLVAAEKKVVKDPKGHPLLMKCLEDFCKRA